jgi:hypothetical protein
VTTPAIENLADISSTWAYLRYLWAFDIPPAKTVNPLLRLSEAARNIDFHQKGLLSDQIGVGMAAVLMGSYLGAPLAADVSVAMDDPAWPIELQYDASPDYLFFNALQTELFVVECKGTQSSRSSSLDQLRRGAEQVPSLVFTDGRVPSSLIVATCLSKRGTRILLLDPPGDDEDGGGSQERPKRVSQREWRIPNAERFARTSRLISEAKLLSFAGAAESAVGKVLRAEVSVPKRPRSASRQPQVTENEFGVFRGVSQRVGTIDRFDIDVFQGVEASLYDALVEDDPERTAEELDGFRRRSGSILSPEVDEQRQPIRTTHKDGVLSVMTVGPDGTLLGLRVASQ